MLPDNFYKYVDGGAIGNPRITPSFSALKPNQILSIKDDHLHVVCDHLPFPDKGLIDRFAHQASDIVLVPRSKAFFQLQTKCDDSVTLCHAFDKVEKRVKLSQSRGTLSKSVIHECDHKYICVGNQTNRGGIGIRKFHKALFGCPQHISSRIMRYFKGVEHLFTMFMDTEEICFIDDAIEEMQPETLSMSNLSKKASIYGAIACGVNVYLASHVDADYTYSATSVHCRCEYHLKDLILCYFAFPRLGIAIPLRPGDVLFFNPNEPY